MQTVSKIKILSFAAASVVLPQLALAGVGTNTAGAVQQGQSSGGSGNPSLNNSAATISLSGQTALRGFTAGVGPTLLQPGTSITLYNGTGNAATSYYSTNNALTSVQLASRNFLNADTGVGASSFGTATDIQNHSGLRIEWHEQGSLDGFYDLLNDQVGYNGAPISNYSNRGPSTANPTWINGSQFTAGGSSLGHTISGTSGAAAYDTYSTSVYDRPSGKNLTGGQNRIQVAIGEYGPENFSFSGSPSVFKAPTSAGYGLGNPALKAGSQASGQGIKNSRQSFLDQSVANLSTDKIDPQTGTNYPAGPWNTAGASNIDSKQVAVTAVTVSANPGTGLRRLNLSDSQWLQTVGRLSNGAEFNYVSRVANTGQRNVLATNTGIDPTWAVGENDGGDTGTTAQANAQKQIGPNIRFSGKTSGTESRNAIANSRFAVGALSLAEARGASSAAPVRTLDIDFVNSVDSNAFTHLDSNSFLNLTYKAILISHYNTVKAPNLAYASDSASQWAARTTAQTGIKGDTGVGLNPVNGNVSAFINNIINSTGTAASGLTTTSVSNPADAIFVNGFFVPGLLNYSRAIDGGPLTPNNLNPSQLALQADVVANYPAIFTTDGSSGSSIQTRGSNAFYATVIGAYSTVNGTIPITEKDASGVGVSNGTFAPKGNYLAGNFNQDGRRDYSSIKEGVNAALSLARSELAAGTPGKSSIFTSDGGNTNGTVIASISGTPGWASTANTKGDLIVLGDINSDGAYDGQDVYLLSRGASLSDATGGEHLTTASGVDLDAQLRNPNARLNKNAALDYARSQTTALGVDDGNNAARAFLRQTGRATLIGASLPAGATLISNNSDGTVTYTFDSAGINAFNKLDVNRDGRTNFYDVAIVDGFSGKSTNNISHQLSAVLATNQNDGGLTFYGTAGTDPTLDNTTNRRQFSLIDAELNDDKNINASDVIVANTALTGAGNDEWFAGNTYKTGSNTIIFNRSSSSVTLGVGAKLNILDGTVENAGADVFTSGASSIDIDTASSGTFKVSGGSNTKVSHITGSGSTVATGAGSKLTAKSGIKQSGLSISSGAQVEVLANGSSTGVTRVSSLVIDATSKLDLHDNDLVVDYGAGLSNYSTIFNKVRDGLALLGGTDVNAEQIGDAGIGSTEVDLQTINGTVLAVVDNGDPNVGGGITSISGYVIPNPATSVLVKYTWFGDANLDGIVDGSDYALTDTGFTSGGSLSSWVFGDYNYDGIVTGEDYALIDTGFIAQTGALPEPSNLCLLALAASSLVRKRRTK